MQLSTYIKRYEGKRWYIIVFMKKKLRSIVCHSVKINDEDYRKLKFAAARTHRTIAGTISHLIATSEWFNDWIDDATNTP